MPHFRLRSVVSQLIAGLVLLAMQTASAQQGASIVGRVLDARTVRPVGAQVVLIPDDGTTPPLMSTTFPGPLYHFDDVPVGSYRVQALGYSDSIRVMVSVKVQPEALDVFGRIVAQDLVVSSPVGDTRRNADPWQLHFLEGENGSGLLGLLELPDVVHQPCGHDSPAHLDTTSGQVHYLVADRTPDGRSCEGGVLALLRPTGLAEAIPTLESGYEYPAAIVLERSGNRFRIALQDGATWVERRDATGFLPYPALLVGHLAYLRGGWDGRYWSVPDGGRSQTVSKPWLDHLKDAGAISVEVLATRSVAGRSWIQVRLDPETCGEQLPNVQAVTVWVPAYRPSGATNAWFYSRGC